MTDITQVVADVGLTTTSPSKKDVIYGVTVAEGDVVYLNTTTSKYELALATSVTASVVAGIALTPGLVDEKGVIATGGDMECGGPTVEGEIYVCSGTAGKIAPVADLAASDYTSIIGYGKAGTNVLQIAIKNTGLLHA